MSSTALSRTTANIDDRQTIMSTDIVTFDSDETGDSQKLVQPGAIQLYMAITIPLTLFVFVAWYGVYWWVDRKERLNKRRVMGVTTV